MITFVLSLLCTPALADGPQSGAADVAVALPAEAPPAVDPLFVPIARVAKLPGLVTADSKHADVERLYVQGRYEDGLALAKQKIATAPTDPDLYWLIARFMFEIGERFDRTDGSIDKEAHYSEMRSWSEKGLAISPGHPHLRFARGIAMGRLGTTRGVLSSLFMAKSIEADWTAVAESGFTYATPNGQEVLPCDSWQALGIFYRLVPEWWIVGVIAGTKGDLDKSIEVLSKANACMPNTIRNLKELGVSQVCRGQKRKDPESIAQGVANLERMITLPAGNPTERTDLKHGRMLLDDLDLACEYSRDGQQDLDEDKLQK